MSKGFVRRSMLVALIAGLCITSAGCAYGAFRRASSPHVGCRPDEVTIEDLDRGWGTTTWVAVCRGQRFNCAAVGGESTQVDCGPHTSGGEAAAERACIPNETQRCVGPDGCEGAQACTADGMAYTPCDCGD